MTDHHKDTRKGSRRSLAAEGGRARTRGDAEAAKVLASALAAIDPAKSDVLTHGFHSYPARMHFGVARTLLSALARPNTRVLDPFCGSGTVLVEAFARRLPATGMDLSPLALRVSEVKCAYRNAEQIDAFIAKAHAIRDASAERVAGKVRINAPLPRAERRWYDPHVLLELAGLFAEIGAHTGASEEGKSKRRSKSKAPKLDFDRLALEMVFSAIVVKFSRQRSDTAEEEVARSIAPGAATSFFGRKAEELGRRWSELAERVTVDTPHVQLRQADARDIAGAVGPKRRYDLVLSSPPYGGTYDYVDHHRRRAAWLGLSLRALESHEVGARRTLDPKGSTKEDAERRWNTEVTEMLASIGAVLSGPDANVVLFVGDGEVAGKRIDAEQQLRELAPSVGMRVIASASLPRLDWHGGPRRAEHLVQLRLG